MREYDIDFIEAELENFKEDLRQVLKSNPMYYVKLTGISKQHISFFINKDRGMSLPKLKHIYKKIQEDDNK